MRPRFRVLVLYENAGHHVAYTDVAVPWLNRLAADSAFAIDYIQNTESISGEFLQNYQLFIQLDYPPYGWTNEAASAFVDYVEQGKGGWIGFHHASLLGEFDGYPMWQWFCSFMGGIRYQNYIATFAEADVAAEQPSHPVMKDVPQLFHIKNEEWYTYDSSPRPNVEVIAAVNETTYRPDTNIKMGDHPVVWSNPTVKARNVYIFMGHSPDLFDNPAYTTLFRNAIFWAAGSD